MAAYKKVFSLGALVVLFLCGSGTSPMAFGPSPFGNGSFGGELRGATRVTGRILCITCTVKDVQETSVEQAHSLYVFTHGRQQAVFQVTAVGKIASGQDASQLSYWQAVTGLTRQVAIRTAERLWEELIAAENVRKEVELIGLLRSTGTFDMAELKVVEPR